MRKLLFILFLSFFAFQSRAQSNLDKKQIIQACIDLEDLQPYYHIEEEGRKPLIIFDNGVIPNTLKLLKFEESVVFATTAALFTYGKVAYLQFSKFTITKDKAEVIFKYHVEGITVKVIFEKIGGTWVVISDSISEK